MSKPEFATVTVILPSGELPIEWMKVATEVAEKYNLKIYFSLAQNLRLIGVKEEDIEAVKAPFAALGAQFKTKGKIHKPRMCTGKRYCNMGHIDTDALSAKIMARYGSEMVGTKVKLSIAGCGNCCSNPKKSDIGMLASAKGINIYLGGQMGRNPSDGVLAVKNTDDDKVLEVIGRVVEFYQGLEGKKMRLCRHLEADESLLARLVG